jgi:phosphoheptose isomerase
MPLTNPSLKVAASNTTYGSGTMVLSGGANVTVGTNAQTVTISAAAQTAQTANVHNVTLSGNTAGAMAQVSSGTLTLAGGNNVTLSQAGNAITISGPNTSAQQTAISGLVGSNATYTSGTVTITGVGGGVTVSSNTGQRIDISVAAPVAQSVQPGVQQIIASNASFSSGTVSISGFGDVTVNTAANIIRISAPTQTAQTGISSIAASDATYTSGQVQFTGSNMITVKSSANQRVVIDATQTLQTSNVHNVTLSGNTSGAMAQISSGTLTLAGGNNITLSQAGNAVTISAGAGGGGFAGGGISGGNTAGDTGSVTGRLLFAGSNNITLSGSTNAGSMTITVSGPTTVAQSVQTQNVHNLSISTTAGGGTAGTMAEISSGTVTLYAGNNITISQSATNKLVISGPNTAAQTGTQFSAGLSNIGNTAGDTGTVAGRLIFAGTPSITLSGSTNGVSQTITISAPATSSLSAYTNITLSVAGSTVKFSVADPPPIDYFDNMGGAGGASGITQTAMTFNTLLLQPLTPFNELFPGKMTASTAMLQFSVSATASSSHSSTVGVGIYTRVNETQLSLLNSVATSWAQGAATNQTASYNGQRWLTIHSSQWSAQPVFNQSMYWMGLFVRSSNASHTGSFVGQVLQNSVQRSGSIMSSVATNTQLAHYPFMGIHSVSQTAFPATIAHSDINKAHALAPFVPNIVFNNITRSF